MVYQVVAQTAMLVHFAFLIYVTVGGFLAWRWPRTFWTHLLAGAWGLLVIMVDIPCPLTYAEDWGRRHAGGPGLAPTGFIDHYVEGVIYPERYTALLRGLVVAAIAISWLGCYARRRARAKARPDVRFVQDGRAERRLRSSHEGTDE